MKRWFGRDTAPNKYETSLLDNVQEHGWHDTHVFDPDGNDPSFSYSIGFTTTLCAPEFIIFGLDKELMHSMLWTVFRQIKDGKEVVDGGRWSDLIEGFDCISRAVDPEYVVPSYVNSAIWFWNRSGQQGVPPVFQLVWPGKLDGLFPWDDGCDDWVKETQPALWSRTTN